MVRKSGHIWEDPPGGCQEGQIRENGLQNGPKTCFGDFSAIMRPLDPVPTPIDAKWIALCTSNILLEVLTRKTEYFGDFMATEG